MYISNNIIHIPNNNVIRRPVLKKNQTGSGTIAIVFRFQRPPGKSAKKTLLNIVINVCELNILSYYKNVTQEEMSIIRLTSCL